MIRACDPCLSRSTHELGQIALDVQLVAPDHMVVDQDETLQRYVIQFVPGLVRTEWIAGQRITRKCESPRPGTAAYPGVLASTAFALELSGRMQRTQKRGMAVNIHEMIEAHVASYKR